VSAARFFASKRASDCEPPPLARYRRARGDPISLYCCCIDLQIGGYMSIVRLLIPTGFLLAASYSQVYAQTLPAPSRLIYKCEVAGKISYTDEPCLGAKRMDIEPSRGLDKFSGKKMTGADVATEKRREQLADAIGPATGINRQQFSTEVRRHNHNSSTKAECRQLDQDLLDAEAMEAATPRENLRTIQQDLLLLRKQFKELRC
jgi:hypothetical protein